MADPHPLCAPQKRPEVVRVSQPVQNQYPVVPRRRWEILEQVGKEAIGVGIHFSHNPLMFPTIDQAIQRLGLKVTNGQTLASSLFVDQVQGSTLAPPGNQDLEHLLR